MPSPTSEAPAWHLYAVPDTGECGGVPVSSRMTKVIVPDGAVGLATLPVQDEDACAVGLQLIGDSTAPDDPCGALVEIVRVRSFIEPLPEQARATVCSAFGMEGGPLQVHKETCYPDELAWVSWLDPPPCGPEAQSWVVWSRVGGAALVALVLVGVWLLLRRRRA